MELMVLVVFYLLETSPLHNITYLFMLLLLQPIQYVKFMKGGILEVFLVNARDIKHTNLFGSRAYYVMVECGNHEHRTRVSSGKHEKVCWNEKFSFELPSSDWKNITHIKFRIMQTKFLSNESVGAIVIYLGGIISEGYERGFIEVRPAPYNVVLEEDDTYKGEIKIGFKFFTKEEIVQMEAREFIADVKQERKPIYGKVMNLWTNVWLKLLCLFGYKNFSSGRKQQ
ncbi:uncharacterized protein LOC111791648 isoform X2 [Cucurbita pepo subsp. pepo]|uniref:uncharacterized protein LOC111791648 isoform X2 n=2 Tax=Cucurbita pepo subsp. pepo TaxID=3664 RepID=UPI000C9D51F5|nr:uncharacterized protein LOC111791648 isoform X2 [Cucurbita pepo subsp. pepo]